MAARVPVPHGHPASHSATHTNPATLESLMTVTPTPEQIDIAELNGWDPQEHAENEAHVARVHELTRKHSKARLLRIAFTGGLADFNNPASWTKQELAAEIAGQERRKAQQS